MKAAILFCCTFVRGYAVADGWECACGDHDDGLNDVFLKCHSWTILESLCIVRPGPPFMELLGSLNVCLLVLPEFRCVNVCVCVFVW